MSRGFRIERTEILCVLFDSELMFACLIHPVVSSVVQKLGIAINEIFEVFYVMRFCQLFPRFHKSCIAILLPASLFLALGDN